MTAHRPRPISWAWFVAGIVVALVLGAMLA